MELGEYPEHPCELELDDAVREAVSRMEEECKEQKLVVAMELEPVKIFADPMQIQRIVTNILENSLKYKSKKEGHIVIRLAKEDGMCKLSFLDDGPGVPEESIPHLFEVFYRSDPATKNPNKGSGLGLAIVANAVARMGGKTWACNGEKEGLEIYIMLPGLDGFEVCRKLREKVDVPILMVTARQEDIDKIRGLGLGADDYIDKPFSPTVLVARVKANLAQYKRLAGQKKQPAEIKIGEIRVNTGTHRVYVGEREVELKNKEYELLLFFMMHVDLVFDRETLYEKVWGLEAIGDNATVAVHINRLREKLEKEPSHPRYIETVWSAGYRFRR